ncbi:hypothetical protein FB45DRAFT_879697, partial [Roridomyces roridus]
MPNKLSHCLSVSLVLEKRGREGSPPIVWNAVDWRERTVYGALGCKLETLAAPSETSTDVYTSLWRPPPLPHACRGHARLRWKRDHSRRKKEEADHISHIIPNWDNIFIRCLQEDNLLRHVANNQTKKNGTRSPHNTPQNQEKPARPSDTAAVDVSPERELEQFVVVVVGYDGGLQNASARGSQDSLTLVFKKSTTHTGDGVEEGSVGAWGTVEVQTRLQHCEFTLGGSASPRRSLMSSKPTAGTTEGSAAGLEAGATTVDCDSDAKSSGDTSGIDEMLENDEEEEPDDVRECEREDIADSCEEMSVESCLRSRERGLGDISA